MDFVSTLRVWNVLSCILGVSTLSIQGNKFNRSIRISNWAFIWSSFLILIYIFFILIKIVFYSSNEIISFIFKFGILVIDFSQIVIFLVILFKRKSMAKLLENMNGLYLMEAKINYKKIFIIVSFIVPLSVISFYGITILIETITNPSFIEIIFLSIYESCKYFQKFASFQILFLYTLIIYYLYLNLDYLNTKLNDLYGSSSIVLVSLIDDQSKVEVIRKLSHRYFQIADLSQEISCFFSLIILGYYTMSFVLITGLVYLLLYDTIDDKPIRFDYGNSLELIPWIVILTIKVIGTTGICRLASDEVTLKIFLHYHYSVCPTGRLIKRP